MLCHLGVPRGEEGNDCAKCSTKDEEKAAISDKTAFRGRVIVHMSQEGDLGKIELVPWCSWSCDAIARPTFQRRSLALLEDDLLRRCEGAIVVGRYGKRAVGTRMKLMSGRITVAVVIVLTAAILAALVFAVIHNCVAVIGPSWSTMSSGDMIVR